MTFANNPNCGDCGRRKGPKQRERKRCYSCQRSADKAAKTAKHAAHIQATYGISEDSYRALWAFQAGKCAVCARATGTRRRLAVDHDHSCKAGHAPNTGCPECVRGLLCGICNVYIGRVRDDPRVGDRLARYLREPPFREMRAA